MRVLARAVNWWATLESNQAWVPPAELQSAAAPCSPSPFATSYPTRPHILRRHTRSTSCIIKFRKGVRFESAFAAWRTFRTSLLHVCLGKYSVEDTVGPDCAEFTDQSYESTADTVAADSGIQAGVGTAAPKRKRPFGAALARVSWRRRSTGASISGFAHHSPGGLSSTGARPLGVGFGLTQQHLEHFREAGL